LEQQGRIFLQRSLKNSIRLLYREGKLEEIEIKLKREELELILHALSSTIPAKDNEKLQFLLYHRLEFKLKEMK
jgi:hypothetical protein